ncbi:hypothetical protein KM043_014506 [Ampulex compressa]|nr:hypothetical protein KM043_014506 [Ampulex compressa]
MDEWYESISGACTSVSSRNGCGSLHKKRVRTFRGKKGRRERRAILESEPQDEYASPGRRIEHRFELAAKSHRCWPYRCFSIVAPTTSRLTAMLRLTFQLPETKIGAVLTGNSGTFPGAIVILRSLRPALAYEPPQTSSSNEKRAKQN